MRNEYTTKMLNQESEVFSGVEEYDGLLRAHVAGVDRIFYF